MSTAILSAGPSAHRMAAPRTRLRLTVRGRRVLAALAAAPVVAGLAAAIVGGGAALATREDGAGAEAFDLVTVTAGDTLWSIAQEVAPGHDPRDVVYELKALNNLAGGVLTPGQQISVPAAYGH